jgi:diphthamide biosynthesis protein 7
MIAFVFQRRVDRRHVINSWTIITRAAPLFVVSQWCADSVEFCPNPGFEEYFAVGNYELLPETGEKVGRVYLYSCCPQNPAQQNDDNSTSSASLGMFECSRVDTAATLDLKWAPPAPAGVATASAPLLAQACADGNVELYELRQDENAPEEEEDVVGGDDALARNVSLHHSTSFRVGSGSLCLSLSWSPRTDESLVAVTQANGSVAVLALDTGGELREVRTWNAHDYEAWICAYNAWQPDVLYTGADDCLFKAWDVRTAACTHTSKEHEMGVTVIQSSPHHEHVLATGSYDEKVRVWDDRLLGKPLATHALGGGLWRLKWHPNAAHANLMLLGCMHNGFRVVTVDGLATDATTRVDAALAADIGDLSITEQSGYYRHTSLAYGCDWCHADTVHRRVDTTAAASAAAAAAAVSSATLDSSPSTASSVDTMGIIASCSFYDKQLRLWRASPPLLQASQK